MKRGIAFFVTTILLTSCGGYEPYHSDTLFCDTQNQEKTIHLDFPVTILFHTSDYFVNFRLENGQGSEDFKTFLEEEEIPYQERKVESEEERVYSYFFFRIFDAKDEVYDSFAVVINDAVGEGAISNCTLYGFAALNILLPLGMANIVEIKGLGEPSNYYLGIPYETSYAYEDFKTFYQQSRQKLVQYDDKNAAIAFSNQILLTVSEGSVTFSRWSDKR